MKKFLASLLLFLACVACVTCVACGNGNKVTISLVYGDNEVTEQQLGKGSDYTLPDAEREGYEFEGWYDNSGFTGQVVKDITASSDATYYAKWAKLFTVTLDADGGSLSSTSFKLKEGANLYDALASYTPTKTDHQFDAWMDNTTPVALNRKMPSSDITLKARYKVKYTVKIFKQSIEDESNYEAADDFIGYGYAGATLTPELPADVMTGFTLDAGHEGSVTSLALGETASANEYKYYLTRNTYTVTFYTNYPDGVNDKWSDSTAKYGVDVTIPADVEYEGYCLAGWATSLTGEIAYEVDSLQGKVFNAKEQGAEAAKFQPSDDMGLYAVWKKGYTDMFGGGDYIFIFGDPTAEKSDVKIYLNRDGIYFAGTFNKSSGDAYLGDATFEDENNEGNYREYRLYDNGMFVMYDAGRANVVYYRFMVGRDETNGAYAFIRTNETLLFQSYDTLMYNDENGQTSEGKFERDDDGNYFVTFTEGAKAGDSFVMTLILVTTANGTENAFRVRNDEQLELAKVFRGVLNAGTLTYYLEPSYTVTFNGYDTGRYSLRTTSGVNYQDCICFLDGDDLTLYTISSTGATSLLFRSKLIDINGEKCYVIYNSREDFTATANGESLKLDGTVNATYTSGDTTVTGYYTSSSTGFGSMLITMYVGGEEYANFIITSTEAEDGAVTYSFTKKAVGYREYIYATDRLYTGTYLVLDDDGVNAEGKHTASLYGSDSEGNRQRVSTGTYELVNGLYVYTKLTLSVPEGVTVPFPADFDEFVFTLATRSTGLASYRVTLWTQYSKGEDKTNFYQKEYSAESGSDKLALLSAGTIAIYTHTDDGNTTSIAGSYTISDYDIAAGKKALILSVGSSGNLYFSIDDGTGKFELLDGAPYKIFVIGSDRVVDENKWIISSGIKAQGDAYYAAYYVKDGDNTTETKGTVVYDVGTNVYTFTPESGDAIKYKIFVNNSANERYMAQFNADFEGRFTSVNDGLLILDGYGTSATFGSVSEAMYRIDNGNRVVILGEDTVIYLDLDLTAKTFVKLDGAFGTYILFDNNYINGHYFSFDGKGGLSVYTRERNADTGEYENKYIDEHGTYTYDGEVATVEYNSNGVDIKKEGVFRILIINSSRYPAFCFTYSSIVNTKYGNGRYIDTSDWSVIELSGSSTAVRYKSDGTVESGLYAIITSDLFYFSTTNGTDAAIYKYDAATATAVPVNLKRAYGYYTEDMDMLFLSQYGFAIIGDTNMYYEIQDNTVILYERVEENGADVNDYGFRKVELGEVGAKQYDFREKTYVFNDGSGIIFNRVADDEKYPINTGTEEKEDFRRITALSFTPSGNDAAFTTTGRVTFGTGEEARQSTCRVTRRLNDDGTSVYYIIIGNYRATVTLSYKGVDDKNNSLSTFTVTALEEFTTLYSDTYLMNNLISSLFGGSAISNTWGNLELVTAYGEDGKPTETKYINGTFGPNSYMFDRNGELMSLNKISYTFDEEAGTYTAAWTGKDGYGYEMQFTSSVNQFYGVAGYTVNYVTRSETLTDSANGYTLTANVLITSDLVRATGYGLIYSMKLTKDNEEIPYDCGVNRTGGVYYVSRTYTGEGDDKKITGTEYYSVDIKRVTLTDADRNTTYGAYIIPPFETAVTITKLDNVKTYYTEDGKSYMDIDETGHAVLGAFIYSEADEELLQYSVSKSEYSDTDSSYVITLSTGANYKVTVNSTAGTITLTLLETEDDDETAGDGDSDTEGDDSGN